MKNLMKTLTIVMLTIAIVVTNIVIPMNNTTVSAAALPEFRDTKSLTMKPGDTKRFLLTGKTPDNVDRYKWSSSDENIVKVETDFVDQTKDYTLCIILKAVSSGTVTITGKCMYAGIKGYPDTVTMTVKVSLPKATAKQKKCKHKYKTTKKATCERNGIKTCKKCKYQKEIKKIAHKYITESVPVTAPTGFWFIRECDCGFQLKVEFTGQISGNSVYTTLNDKTAWFAQDSPYQSWEDVMTAWSTHPRGENGYCVGFEEWEEQFGSQHYYETQTICKYCGREKQNIEATEPK